MPQTILGQLLVSLNWNARLLRAGTGRMTVLAHADSQNAINLRHRTTEARTASLGHVPLTHLNRFY